MPALWDSKKPWRKAESAALSDSLTTALGAGWAPEVESEQAAVAVASIATPERRPAVGLTVRNPRPAQAFESSIKFDWCAWENLASNLTANPVIPQETPADS